MKTYKLIVIADGGRVSKYPDAEVKGFVEAEKKANELLLEYYQDYPSDDTYVVCVEDESEMWWDDYLCLVRDIWKEQSHWFKMKNGSYCPIGLRLLTETEQEDLDLRREEKEMHIWDLDEEQLKKLRSEICLGSCFYSDYQNSFEIDEKEVCDFAEGYSEYITEEEHEDTPEQFAEYCMCIEAY